MLTTSLASALAPGVTPIVERGPWRRLFGAAGTYDLRVPGPAVPRLVAILEGDEPGWQAGSGPTEIIDFDTIPGSETTPIAGDEFEAFAGQPFFEASPVNDEIDFYVGVPPFGSVAGTSAPNTFFPECDPSCKGIARVHFDTAVRAVGATFADVEGDFATTGFSITPNSPVPEIAFTSNPGAGSARFLGFIASEPLDFVDIHFTTGPTPDGSAFDDLQYEVVVPEPAVGAGLSIGVGLVGWLGRRRGAGGLGSGVST